MITIYSRTPDPATLDRKVLNSFFTTERGEDDVRILHRKRSVSPRQLSRILFPRFVVKTNGNKGKRRYQLKPDGWATFLFFIFVAVSAIALFDPNAAEEYSPWFPIAFVGWYVFRALIEIIRTKAAFDRATNGQPVAKSDLVAKVTELLEAEEAADKDNNPKS